MVVLLTLVTKIMDFVVADVWLERECSERELRPRLGGENGMK